MNSFNGECKKQSIDNNYNLETDVEVSENVVSDTDILQFKRFELLSIPEIIPFFKQLESYTCDFTIGGIYMWIDYFKYRYCIINDTLFIIGRDEANTNNVAFSMPVGAMPLRASLDLVQKYCKANNVQAIFSAVPEEYVESFKSLNPLSITELPHWADYLYSAQELNTLSGKKFSKKRNHINKFNSLYQSVETRSIDSDNINDVIEFYKSLAPRVHDETMAHYEYKAVGEILENYGSYNFCSIVLYIDNKIASFMIGEIVNDTLHAHIEKTNHDYEGASEYINNKFISMALKYCPTLKYENRQDDAGDPGLQQSKLSYNPIALLKKYNIKF